MHTMYLPNYLTQIKYDFKWLSLLPEPVEESKLKSHNNDQPLRDGLPPHQKHLPILNGMVSHGRVDLLSHDLSQKYLQMKWNAYGKYFQLANLVLYLLYVCILTAFTTSSNSKDSHHYDSHGMLTFKHVTNCSVVIGSNHEKCITEKRDVLWRILIVAVSGFNISREIVNIFRHRSLYTFNFENGVWWAMNISSLSMVFMPLMFAEPLQNPCASLSAFLCWFYLLVFLQRFDIVGIYVVMFLEILYTLLRVLMIFSVLIIAFALAFYILLSNGQHIAFENVTLSIVRTFAMMLGDLDFMNSFLYPHYCYKLERGGTNPTKNKTVLGECRYPQRLPHPDMSFLMLGIYMLLMPILLMNLLIGLAVGDIESVRQNAQLKRLTMQVELHTSLEKSLPMFILRKVDRKEVVEYPNLAKANMGVFDFERIFKYFQPKNAPKDAKRHSKTIEDVIFAVQEAATTVNTLCYELDNLKTMVPLVRQICHKLELSTDYDYIDEGSHIEEASLMSDLRGRFRRGVTIRRTKRLPPQRSDSDVF
ncbi:unnamed protein product [Allacma fusca]|uniref:Ion transport domain-containing protein n=1 Tax=Allacma fusca TaxID=39272 RepID=A0A8J2K629_9HEXA|nr:unnamed protein product [Allacma fusca]